MGSSWMLPSSFYPRLPNPGHVITFAQCSGPAGAWLGGIGMLAFRFVWLVAAAYGASAAALVVPLAWLFIGAAMCAASVVTKRLFAPRLSPRRPIRMFSFAFFRWWLVRHTHALIGLTRPLLRMSSWVIFRGWLGPRS